MIIFIFFIFSILNPGITFDHIIFSLLTSECDTHVQFLTVGGFNLHSVNKSGKSLQQWSGFLHILIPFYLPMRMLDLKIQGWCMLLSLMLKHQTFSCYLLILSMNHVTYISLAVDYFSIMMY